MNKRDISFGIAFILISIVMFMETFNFYNPPQQIAEPALWPRIILTLLVLLSLGLIYSGIKGKPQEEHEKEESNRAGDLRVVLAMLATVVFLAVFKPLGFVISIIFYFLAITYILEPKKDLKTFALRFAQALALSLLIHFIFGVALSVRLPHGILPKKWFR